MPYTQKSEVLDGMHIDWNIPIRTRDGSCLYADVYRPAKAGKYPVILSHGPYGKGLAFQDGYRTAWDIMAEKHPDVTAGSTNKYQNWEVVDPEKWVPHDYAVVRVDSRGAGASPGFMALWSPQETRDMYDCIEWAGQQGWSNGKVGLTASRILVKTNGRWPLSNPRTWRPFAFGKGPRTSIAISATMAASCAISSKIGTTCRSSRYSMA